MVSWSSAIWCITSQADTLLQDKEFFSISILLYDLFAIFSIYRILKNSHCGAVLFFFFLGLIVRSLYASNFFSIGLYWF